MYQIHEQKRKKLSTFVDDGSFMLKDRRDPIVGSIIAKEEMAKSGSIMHAVSSDEKSETEISHVPCDEKIRKWRKKADENVLTNNGIETSDFSISVENHKRK